MPQAIAGTIALLLFNAGAPIALANFFVSAAGVALVSTTVGIGLSLASAALLKSRIGQLKPSDAQNEIKLDVAPRQRSIGTTRRAGIRFWGQTRGTDPDTIWLGWAFNHGRIGAVLERFVDENLISIDGAGEILSPLIYANNGADEVHYILSRMGSPSESAYSELETAFGVPDVRGDGVATVVASFNNWETADQQLDRFPNGIPEYKQTDTGSVVFDPREAAHDQEDESTWESSENPVVHLFHYCFVDPDGYGMGYARVEDNLAEWTAAMDACDVAVAKADATTEARYRCAGTYLLTDDPKDVVARILSTCDGKIWPRRDGQIGVAVGVFVEPTVAIADEHILAYEVTAGPDRLQKASGVRAEYLSPLHGYREQEAEPWPDGATVVALGEERAVALDLTWVPSPSQARRLMKREYYRRNADWRLTIVTDLAGLRAVDERYIHVAIDELDGLDTTFEITRFSFDPSSFQVTMELVSVASDIDDWDAATEEGTEPEENPLILARIDSGDHTIIGDMSNMSRAFDGGFDESENNCATGSGSDHYIGLSFATPKAFKKLLISGSNNRGYRDDATSTFVDLRVYGKNGAAPSSPTDGTLLRTLSTFEDSDDESTPREIGSSDYYTRWSHLWVRITLGTGDVRVGEVEFYG